MGCWAIFRRIVIVAAAFPAVTAQAQSPHEIVQPSLVYLELDYTPGSGQAIGVPQKAQATGFFVSEDGFILTSYHLIEEMVATQGANMKLKAFLGEPGSPFNFESAIVNTLRPLDLMLLKIRPSTQVGYEPVKLGRSDQIGDQPIFTSGFHGDQPFSRATTVANKLGPLGVGYLWAINTAVAAGQSGSPVYLADGTVIGMLKGESETAHDIGYMVPIEYADALIAHLRVGSLEARLAKVESGIRDVGGYYDWSAEMTGGRLIISYKKLIAGDPQIQSVQYSVIPFVDKDTGETLKDSPLAKASGEVIVDANGKGGQIVVPSVDELIRTKLSVTADAVRISALDVVVVPTTAQGEQLPPTPALHVTVVKAQ